MDWKIKTAIIGSSIIVLSSLAFIVKVQNDTINKLKVIETSITESKNLGDGLVRAQSGFITKKDLEVLVKDHGIDLSAVKQDLSVLDANIKVMQTIKTVTPGYNGTNIQSTVVVKDPNAASDAKDNDKYGYLATTQWLDLTEPFGGSTNVKFGKVGFSASEQKPWSLTISPRTYRTATVLGEDKDGRHYAYSKTYIDVEGKTYTIPIAENKVVEEYPDPNFFFTPRLYLGIDGGAIINSPMHSEIFPNIGLSFLSYGNSKTLPELSFLTLGIGYTTKQNSLGLFISPIDYNVARYLPLVDNLFIGPAMSIDFSGNIGAYIGIRVGL